MDGGDCRLYPLHDSCLSMSISLLALMTVSSNPKGVPVHCPSLCDLCTICLLVNQKVDPVPVPPDNNG